MNSANGYEFQQRCLLRWLELELQVKYSWSSRSKVSGLVFIHLHAPPTTMHHLQTIKVSDLKICSTESLIISFLKHFSKTINSKKKKKGEKKKWICRTVECSSNNIFKRLAGNCFHYSILLGSFHAITDYSVQRSSDSLCVEPLTLNLSSVKVHRRWVNCFYRRLVSEYATCYVAIIHCMNCFHSLICPEWENIRTPLLTAARLHTVSVTDCSRKHETFSLLNAPRMYELWGSNHKQPQQCALLFRILNVWIPPLPDCHDWKTSLRNQ